MKQPTFKKLILADLRVKGLDAVAAKIKSIKHEHFSGGDAVRVESIGLLAGEFRALNALLETYRQGSFNGAIDLYEYKKDGMAQRTAMFVTLYNQPLNDIDTV